jgi:hypothetical protein
MSRTPPAPRELSAADRGRPEERCPSCAATTGLITAVLPGRLKVRLCAEPTGCRLRAQRAGQWGRVELTGGAR